jgi:hypothetical protein
MLDYNSNLMKLNTSSTIKKVVLLMLLATLIHSVCNGNCLTCNAGTCTDCADGWDIDTQCTTCA